MRIQNTPALGNLIIYVSSERKNSQAHCFGQFVLVFLLTLTFLFLYSLLLYFYVLAARAVSLAPREDFTSRVPRARWRGEWRRQFWIFLPLAVKRALTLLLEKLCLVLSVLSEAIVV